MCYSKQLSPTQAHISSATGTIRRHDSRDAGDLPKGATFTSVQCRLRPRPGIRRCWQASSSPRGHLLGVKGQYAAGLTDLKRAHAVFEEIDLSDHALTALNAIATLYNRMVSACDDPSLPAIPPSARSCLPPIRPTASSALCS